jgi:hypothetical protein
MAVKDWTKLYQDYKGLWVALEDNEVTVITSGEKLKDVVAEVKKIGYKKPRYTRIPKYDHSMAAFYVANSTV